MFTKSFEFISPIGTYEVKLYTGWYANGAKALQLVDAKTGEPFMTASVNIGELDPYEIAIKNYFENEGVLRFLMSIGFIEWVNNYKDVGYAKVPICQLSKEAFKFYGAQKD